jgi:hypothetical protein
MASGYRWMDLRHWLGPGRGAEVLQAPVGTDGQDMGARTLIATVLSDGLVVVQCTAADPDLALSSAVLSPWRLMHRLINQHLAGSPVGVLGNGPSLNNQDAGLRSAMGLLAGSELHHHRGTSGDVPIWSSRHQS